MAPSASAVRAAAPVRTTAAWRSGCSVGDGLRSPGDLAELPAGSHCRRRNQANSREYCGGVRDQTMGTRSPLTAAQVLDPDR
jgi:hypothetical protein